MVEWIVFFSVIASCFLLLLKSRCIKVGVDQAEQFEPENLSQMINRIFDYVDLDLLQIKNTRSKTKAIWIKKVRKVTVDNLPIYLKLTEEGYETVIKNKIMGKIYLVPPNEASMWFQKNIFGKVKRKVLED